LTLDICQARNDPAAPPAPLGVGPKIQDGRNLHLQGPAHLAGRARVVVQQARPASYAGQLVLRPDNARLALFAQEVAAAGQVPLGSPQLANGTIAAAGQDFWAEGTQVSAALRDAGLRLELLDLPNQEGDRVAATVIKVE